MRRPFWSTPGFRVVFAVGVVLWAAGHCHVEPLVDRARARNYTHRDKAQVTVDLIWPASMNAMEKRYSFEAGARRALEEYWRQGGVFKHIRLRAISEFDADLGEKLKKQANDPSVVAMLGFISSANNLKASVITAKRDIMLIASSATWPVLTKHGFDNLVRLVPNDEDSARLITRFLLQRRVKKIGIMYVMTLHGNSIAPLITEYARRAGIDVAFSRAYMPSKAPTFPEVLNVVGPLLKEHADLGSLVMIDEMGANPLMLRHLRRAGVKVPIVGSDSLDLPGIWDAAGSAAEGTCFVSLWPVSGASNRLAQLYESVVRPEDRQKVDHAAFIHYAFIKGYETMWTYLAAAREAQSLYPRHLGILLRNRTWDGLYGRLRFTPDGDVVGRHMVMCEIRGGRPHEVFGAESGFGLWSMPR